MCLSRISSSTCCLTSHREQCSGALWGDTTKCHGVTRQVFIWKLQEPDHPIEVPIEISQHALPRSLPACNTSLMISFWTISFSMNCVFDIFWALKFHMFSLLLSYWYIFEKYIVYLYYTIQDIICTLYFYAVWHAYTYTCTLFDIENVEKITPYIYTPLYKTFLFISCTHEA